MHEKMTTEPACVTYDEADDIEAVLAQRMSRRSGLALLAAGATAIVGGLSSCSILQIVPPYCLGEPDCCNIATCTECDYEGTKDNFTCAHVGHQPTRWTCVTPDNRVAACGECNLGPTCFTGPFSCSIWYYTD